MFIKFCYFVRIIDYYKQKILFFVKYLSKHKTKFNKLKIDLHTILVNINININFKCIDI